MPTVLDLFQEHFFPPGSGAERDLAEATSKVLQVYSRLQSMAGAVMQRIADLPASEGYEPFFVSRGSNRFIARAMAALVRGHGKRCASEARGLPSVVKSIRFLSKGGRSQKPFIRNANIVLAAWNQTTIVEGIFDRAGLDVFDFVRELEAALTGDRAAADRIAQISKALLPHLSIPRGPKISAESAAHEFLKRCNGLRDDKSSYSWNEGRGEFTDAATKATQREFKNSRFDPRPARRRRQRKSELSAV